MGRGGGNETSGTPLPASSPPLSLLLLILHHQPSYFYSVLRREILNCSQLLCFSPICWYCPAIVFAAAFAMYTGKGIDSSCQAVCAYLNGRGKRRSSYDAGSSNRVGLEKKGGGKTSRTRTRETREKSKTWETKKYILPLWAGGHLH